MIKLKKLNKADFVLNSDLIESIESTPDTTIKLTTGKVIMVAESLEDVVNKVVAFKAQCFAGPRIAQHDVRDGP